MGRKYFGTDGIRGTWGDAVINEKFFHALGKATARILTGQEKENEIQKVLIGCDTRASGPILGKAFASGLQEPSISIVFLGIVPTPTLAWQVRESDATMGVMLTASHNPARDNGIKFFGAGGAKLDDSEESLLEHLLEKELHKPTGSRDATADWIIETDGEGGSREYRQWVLNQFSDLNLKSKTIVLDCAHGATWRTAPILLKKLGADIHTIGTDPDGKNINDRCGSQYPQHLKETVMAHSGSIGIAHDGDGDRLLLVDEFGHVVDGDALLALLAIYHLHAGNLAENTLVATTISNMGLDDIMQAHGGRVVRVPVGDRHVLECMRREGYSLGGESSGHVIIARHGLRGDGITAALEVLSIMQATGRTLAGLSAQLVPYPQNSINLNVAEKIPLSDLPEFSRAIYKLESTLRDRGGGRILVRYSGTEPKIRLLVEAKTTIVAKDTMDSLVTLTHQHLSILP